MSDDIVQNVTEKQNFASKKIDSSIDSYTMQTFVDPFADTIEPAFFATADIRSKLDEVVHLCQFGGNVVALLGDKGVGKTAFLSEARKELADTSFCCVVDAALMVSAEDVFKQMISQLELPVEPSSTIGEMLAALRQVMSDTSFHRVVIIIDDADFLNESIVSGLLSLFQGAQGGQFHLLLSGNNNLIERLDSLDIVDVLIYDVSLDPFTHEDVTEYIDFKFSRVGKDSADYFNQGEIDAIYKQSRGFPAEINSAAQRLLLSNTGADDLDAVDVERKTGLPLLHMGLLIVLLAALIMLLLYVGDDDLPDEASPVSVEILQPPIAKEAEPDAIDLAIAKLDAEAQSQAEAKEVEKPSVGDSVAPLEKTDEAKQPSPADAVDQASQQNQIVPEDAKQPVVSESDIKKELKEELERESERLKAQAGTDKAEPKSAVADDNKQFSAGEQAVLGWSDTAFTLQLIGAGQKESVERYIASQPNASKLVLVSLLRNGKPWYVVITGVYENAQLARRAVQSLPQNQVNGGPWPKKVSDLKRDMRSFRGN